MKWIVGDVGVDCGEWSGLFGELEWTLGFWELIELEGLLYTRAHTHCKERKTRSNAHKRKGERKREK